MTFEETAKIATLIQQVRDIKEDTLEIKRHLEEQSNKIEDTILAVETSRIISKHAQDKADAACIQSQKSIEYFYILEKRFLMLIAFMIGSGVLAGAGFGIANILG
jgi:NurA-like 5'-3' nuclease